MIRNGLKLVGLVGAFFAQTTAFAQLAPIVSWSGSTVYVKANTPSTPQYRCDYTITASFSDGTSQTVSGQTDPPTGGSPITAVTHSFNKVVSSAIANWSCKVKT